jgi:hypothetical protein
VEPTRSSKNIAGNEWDKSPAHQKNTALPIPAIRNGITVFIDIDATYNIPPITAMTFAALTKLSRVAVLK